MNDKYELQISVPLYAVSNNNNHEEYLKYLEEDLLKKGAIEIFSEIYKHREPVVVETHIEKWQDHYDLEPKFYMRLHYRLTAVQHRHVEIPVFSYINHEGSEEWKCPACTMINQMSATFCGEEHSTAAGCGRPRDKVRSEYKKNPFFV